MLKRLLFILVFPITITAIAQDEQELPELSSSREVKNNTNRVYGKVISGKTGKGIESTTLQLFTRKTAGIAYDSLIRTKISKANGDFEFTDLPGADSFRVFISAVGHSSIERLIAFGKKDDGPVSKDLGNIVLPEAPQQLDTVTVTSWRSAMQLAVDRRVFNVEKNITATGGTAVDVMKSIPSLTVDLDGNVSFRNNAPQVFVDGRPTILTLDQIPAESIERVELITNPSARFDASSTAGIINIILKKNRRLGLNGIASLGAGYPGVLNGGLNLNARQGKINLFLSGNYNQQGGIGKSRTLRQNKNNGMIENYFNQYTEEERKRKFGSLRFGIDYSMDNRNTLSLSQNIVNGNFNNAENQDQEYLDQDGVLERYGKRTATTKTENNRYNTQLNYVHKFPEAGKEFSANLNYNYGNGDTRADIYNAFFLPGGGPYNNPTTVRNTGVNENKQLTFQADFVDPKGEDNKIETGLRIFVNDFSNRFIATAINNGTETVLPLSNNIAYREIVHAAYFTYTGKIAELFAYQAGLRAEYSDFEGRLLDSGNKFGYQYPDGFKNLGDGLFPSLFLSKEIDDNSELQLNYSRRIRRPRFNQLNPFLNISDPVNISMGNPALRPEFRNFFELNYEREYEKGNFLFSGYYNTTRGNITRFSDTITTAQYQQLNNAAVDPNAILNTFINAKASNELGAELVLQHKFTDNFEITPSVDIQYRKVTAGTTALQLDNSGVNWEAKLVINYTIETKKPSLFNHLSFQLLTEYESPEVNAQGRGVAEYATDLAIKKEFLKDKKASLTFSVNDIFRTDRWGSVIDTEHFFQDSYRRNVRNFRITFSYKFGNSDFQLFGKENEE